MTCIGGPSQATTDATLYVKNKSQSKKKKKICGFCQGSGHVEEVCRKKAAAMEKEKEKRATQEKEKEKANAAKTLDSSVESSETDDTDVHVNIVQTQPLKTPDSNDDNDFIAVFAANPTAANVTNPSWNDTLLDSGCTRHMSPHRDWFEDHSFIQLEKPVEVHLGDDRIIHATGKGTLEFLLKAKGKLMTRRFPNMLYVPKLATTLISASCIIRNNNVIELNSSGCWIISKMLQKIIGEGELTPTSLYHLKASPIISKAHAKMIKTSRSIDINLLHRRLGHLNFESIKNLVGKGLVYGVTSLSSEPVFCEPCVHGKIHRLPFPKSGKCTDRKLTIVHSDICGPFPVSIGNKRYFITFIDDHSRYISVYFLQKKSEAFVAFKEFKISAELEMGHKLKKLRTDNGGEYLNAPFTNFLKERGILLETTTPETPEQNGLSECVNRTIVERTQTMLHDSSLTLGFWAKAVMFWNP